MARLLNRFPGQPQRCTACPTVNPTFAFYVQQADGSLAFVCAPCRQELVAQLPPVKNGMDSLLGRLQKRG